MSLGAHTDSQTRFSYPPQRPGNAATLSEHLWPLPSLPTEEHYVAQRPLPGRQTVGVSTGPQYSRVSGTRSVSEGNKTRHPGRFRVPATLPLDNARAALNQAALRQTQETSTPLSSPPTATATGSGPRPMPTHFL